MCYWFIDAHFIFTGYHGDINETYPVGKIDEDSERLIRTTRLALDEAIKICKPGALFRDIGKAMSVPPLSLPLLFSRSVRRSITTGNAYLMICSEPVARQGGCAVVRTYTGHGINDLFHCAPNVPHYAKNKAVGTMKAGMVGIGRRVIPPRDSFTDLIISARLSRLSQC